MYQTKKIIYKSVFKSGDDKEVVEYKQMGTIKYDQKTSIAFKNEEIDIEIIYDDEEVILKNHQSVLKLRKDKDILNEYQLPYGQVMLKTRLLKHKYNENYFHLKYELYDHQSLISTVYIVINMI